MRRALLAAVFPAVLGLAACETVDLGSPPADINACRPSQAFFVSDIWPKVLDKDYGGKHCGDSTCHDMASGRPLTLLKIDTSMDPGMVPLTGSWAANYRSATEQMNCSNVKASSLIELPAGIRTHGGGKLFDADTSPESLLIQMWVGVP